MFTLFHVLLSIIGLVSGLVVAGGLAGGRRIASWSAVFIVTNVLTNVTGFGFPFDVLLPSHIVAIVALVVLAGVIVAEYVKHFEGSWRRNYAIGVVIATYLNSFVLVVQLFRRIPALAELAPTQSELPFAVAQVIVLAFYVWLTMTAVRGFSGLRA